ncbi:MAG: PolC-type DNA polymerase III [Clostridia bacterium]|nr:PolC-type DNA polymerase III [Clostridia bacterium]
MRNFLKLLPGIGFPPALAEAEIKPESEIDLNKRTVHIIIESDVLTDSDLADFCENAKNALAANEFIVEIRKSFHKNMQSEQAKLVEEAMKNIPDESKPKPGDIVYGNGMRGEPTPLIELGNEYGRYIVEGDIFKVDEHETKRGWIIYTISITDLTYSINLKLILSKDDKTPKLAAAIKKGNRIRVRGNLEEDRYSHEAVIRIESVMLCEKQVRKDECEEKRVELHCHTKMSALDGFADVGDVIKLAASWGHKAIAITDHGVVHAFPDAYKTAKKCGIKVILGCEGYIANDEDIKIVKGVTNSSLEDKFVVFDLETTGLSAERDEIIEIGAVKVENGKITDRFSEFVNPHMPIPEKIQKLTGINDGMVADAEGIDVLLPKFLEFSGNCVFVAHNADFDMSFVKAKCKRLGIERSFVSLDTLELSRAMFPELSKHKLDTVAKHLGVSLENHHRACDDAGATAEIMVKCLDILKKEKGVAKVNEINPKFAGSTDYKKLKTHHIVLLVKNLTGLRNLYELVSESQVNYYFKRPRMLKSMIRRLRKGLILGTACNAGELYEAIQNGRPQEEIDEIAQFYDYFEIQPLGNNEFLVRDGILPDRSTLIDINKKIIALGERFGKPVVATGDVHFLNKEDSVYREVLMTVQGFSDADSQAPLYLHSTQEMLDEFSYLDPETAHKIVIENPNLIAESVESVRPVPEGQFPPVMEGAPEELEQRCYEKAKRIYGDPLPEIVQKRLERELEPIKKHGFAVMYMIAQRLVAKSNSDGYLVGSRGSVGSSLVAFMAGITEVNALIPHYVCPKCKHSIWVDDGSYSSGCDMPNKACPKCGTEMNKDGHEIPFETFLGFNADKQPDIDLNFSGDYQPTAHKYIEELFGEGFVFRAGTIGVIAEKTAFGYVKKYMDITKKQLSSAEVDRLVCGCTDVKRTTGQHPGGIIVVPRDNSIYNFCPIQHPADDRTSDIITTHFDYHKIDENLLKLDILGHDDPTVIRMLEDLTGFDATTVRLDDPETMSLFTSPAALGVTKEEIDSETGTYAVPEFGTKFARQMLVDTKPTTFAELCRISGLSHGTDVWVGNAQDLIVNDGKTLMEVICTRDDIMSYLIRMGVPNFESFKIMEAVRKGKVAKGAEPKWPEYKELLRSHNVPDWYIASCEKIQYMFPKAHAVAYVTSAFRIAYFKVHYPIEFYCTYYTVRADNFNYDLMCAGVDEARRNIIEYSSKGNEATAKDKDIVTILEVCVEMYCRGIEFLPISLTESDAVKFMKKDGKILPPLNAIDGLGINAAKAIVEARNQESFFSIEDLQVRAKLNKTVVEKMREKGILDGMDESSQMSLF